MILSNTEILRALDEGWLILDPEPAPREPTTVGPECPYQTTAVDLRLGNEILTFQPDQPVTINLTNGGYTKLADLVVDQRFQFPSGQPFTLKPKEFILGRTLERIELPIPAPGSDAPCLAARIEGRSSYARCGLLVHFTAPTIHSGYEGPITLEIINLGNFDIQLNQNVRICQLIIEQVIGRPFRNDSQFQQQATPDGQVAGDP